MDAPLQETQLSLAARSPLRDPLAVGPSAPLIPYLTMQSPGVVPLVPSYRAAQAPLGRMSLFPGTPLPQPAVVPSAGTLPMTQAPMYFDPLGASIPSRFPPSEYRSVTFAEPPAATASRVERPLSPVLTETPAGRGLANIFFGQTEVLGGRENIVTPANSKERLLVRLNPRENLYHAILLLERKGGRGFTDSPVNRILYLTVDIVGKNIRTGTNLVKYQAPKDPAAFYEVLVTAYPQRLAPRLANRAVLPQEAVDAVTLSAVDVAGAAFQIASRWSEASDQEILDELRRRRLPLKAPINRENFLQQLWASEP